MWLLSVGHGPRQILAVAGPHANEPIGHLAVLRMAERLPVENIADTWNFLLCLDPDGARLNEPWLAGPHTLPRYFRDMFRPSPEQQPEWLPADPGEEPLPETRVLLDVLDRLRPAVQFSLHAADLGGVFMQLSRPFPGAAEVLGETAASLGLPCDSAPFDAFHLPSPRAGTFVMSAPAVSAYDLSARSTWFYPAARHGTLTVVLEAPQWVDESVEDSRPSADPDGAREEVVRLLRRRGERVGALLDEAIPLLPTPLGPLAAAAVSTTEACAVIAREWLETPDAGATVGNAASLRISAQRIPLRAAAMLARSLATAPAGKADRLLAVLRQLVAEWSDAFTAEAFVPDADTGEAVPVGAAAAATSAAGAEPVPGAAADPAGRPRWVPVEVQAELQVRTMLGLVGLLADPCAGDPVAGQVLDRVADQGRAGSRRSSCAK